MGPKVHMGSEAEGDLTGGVMTLVCPHQNRLGTHELPAEQVWKYKSADNAWTDADTHGIYTISGKCILGYLYAGGTRAW